ncbi:hypothetical protein HNP25_004315 [Arcicella rosea]|uniref:Uncharacterized protein n=1 Tax=Arcicella rosea TaxID=502909 RepID=A0A841F1H2_9BACT|nr:hypothetical protein [Arcicella rosea]
MTIKTLINFSTLKKVNYQNNTKNILITKIKKFTKTSLFISYQFNDKICTKNKTTINNTKNTTKNTTLF